MQLHWGVKVVSLLVLLARMEEVICFYSALKREGKLVGAPKHWFNMKGRKEAFPTAVFSLSSTNKQTSSARN